MNFEPTTTDYYYPRTDLAVSFYIHNYPFFLKQITEI